MGQMSEVGGGGGCSFLCASELIVLGCSVLTGASVAFPGLKSKMIQVCSPVGHSCLPLGKSAFQAKERSVVDCQMRPRRDVSLLTDPEN